MKNRLFLFAVMAAFVLIVGSCKKEQDSNDNLSGDPFVQTDPLDDFCGTYDLLIVTDSVSNNGTWFSNANLPSVVQIPERSGRLTIAKSATAGQVDVLGRVAIGGDSIDFYRTTGEVDATGRLILASGQDCQTSTRLYHFTFAPIGQSSPLVFKVDASYRFNQTDYIERSSNTATKR